MLKSISLILAILFFSLSAQAGKPPVVKATPELLAKGKTVYSTNCVVCHGEAGDGNGPAGAALNPKPRNFAKDKFKKGDKPEQVFNTVTKGLEGTSMAAFGHLSEEDRWAVTHYVLSFRKK